MIGHEKLDEAASHAVPVFEANSDEQFGQLLKMIETDPRRALLAAAMADDSARAFCCLICLGIAALHAHRGEK